MLGWMLDRAVACMQWVAHGWTICGQRKFVCGQAAQHAHKGNLDRVPIDHPSWRACKLMWAPR
ncbi:hypothetical protein FOA52_010135 [Chlamydomonas sp. UWO 241]|nr:hypothetical protein FOA52_010135 [Chlamydomonas sp. UWO 241]